MNDGIENLEKMLIETQKKIKMYKKIPGTKKKIKTLSLYCKMMASYIEDNKHNLFFCCLIKSFLTYKML